MCTGGTVPGVASYGRDSGARTSGCLLDRIRPEQRRGTLQFKKRLRPSVVIPGALVIAVLVLSFAASHTFNLSGASFTSYGYGYGPGGTCAPPPVQYHPVAPIRILDTRGGTALGGNATVGAEVGVVM